MNRVWIIGDIGNAPEVRTTSTGKTQVKMRVAVRRNYRNANGEYESDWLNVVAWGNTANFISKYLHKGDKVSVDGSIQTGSYEKDGHKVYTFDVVGLNPILSLNGRCYVLTHDQVDWMLSNYKEMNARCTHLEREILELKRLRT